jgi:uncharacterized protein (TIGR03083 family)
MARLHGTKDMWLASMRDEGGAFGSAAAEADLASAVPSCPDWTIADLIHHLGSVYRWVHAHVVRGVTAKPDRSRLDFEAEPRADDLINWWSQEFGSLVSTFDVLDPEMPAWNWAPQGKRVAFWQRRMAHETAVHRWDLQMAIGQAEPIETKLAADGVAEVLDTWLPAGRRHPVAQADHTTGDSGGHLPTGMVALHATDIEHVWHVRLRGEGIALLDTETIFDFDEHPARVVAAGSCSDLMLALYGRVGFDVLDVSGDEELLRSMRVG